MTAGPLPIRGMAAGARYRCPDCNGAWPDAEVAFAHVMSGPCPARPLAAGFDDYTGTAAGSGSESPGERQRSGFPAGPLSLSSAPGAEVLGTSAREAPGVSTRASGAVGGEQ